MRWTAVFFCLLGYFSIQSLRLLVLRGSKSYAWASRISRFWGKPICFLIGVRIRTHGKPINGPQIIIANHLSWLDPLALTGQIGALWITSEDVRRDLFLGSVCKLAACPFVSRNPWSLKNEVLYLQGIAKLGTPLGFFPEATTGDGTGVREFRPAFFAVAKLTGVPIQPLCLHWSHLDENPITRADADRFLYFGGITFFQNLREILRRQTMTLEIHWLPPIDPLQFSDRKELARHAHECIASQFRPIV